MSAHSLLKQFSDERAALVQSAITKAAAVVIGRRRVVSGIVWRKDLIITAAEAVGDAEQVDVRFDGEELSAEVIATDLTTDVSVLRVGNAFATAKSSTAQHAGNAKAAPTEALGAGEALDAAEASRARAALGTGEMSGAASATPHSPPTATSGSLLRIGESVVVVGRNLRGSAAIWGTVRLAGPAWNSRRGGRIDQRLELDVTFDPSFEGGAVINMEGQIAAMAVAGPCHRVLAIPAATIDAVVSKIDQFGRLPKPYIGIRLQPLWLDDATRTSLGRKSRGIAAVGGVDAGSPAAVAHIELGDLLLTLDGEPAESVRGLAQRIAAINPGQTIALEVLRGGKPLTINVQIGERPHH